MEASMRALAQILVLGAPLILGCAPPDLQRDGGTLLLYEVADESPSEDYRPDKLAAAVKRRVDPTGRANILVRAEAKNLEVGLPRGPNHEKRLQQIKELLAT